MIKNVKGDVCSGSANRSENPSTLISTHKDIKVALFSVVTDGMEDETEAINRMV